MPLDGLKFRFCTSLGERRFVVVVIPAKAGIQSLIHLNCAYSTHRPGEVYYGFQLALE